MKIAALIESYSCKNSLSKQEIEELLTLINDITDLLKSEPIVNHMIAKTYKTQKKRSESAVVTKEHIPVFYKYVTTTQTRQLQKLSQFVYTSIPLFIQNIFDDARNNLDFFWLNSFVTRKYDENGITVRGSEFWDGNIVKEYLSSLNNEFPCIFLIIHVDGTVTCSGKRTPVNIQVLNGRLKDALKNSAMRFVALMAEVFRRSEYLDESQKSTISQIAVSVFGHIMSDVAQIDKPIEFRLRKRDLSGNMIQYNQMLNVGCGMVCADMAEKKSILAISHCPNCNGYEINKQNEKNSEINSDKEGKAYMNIENGCFNGTMNRTVEDYLRMQRKIFEISKRSKTEADEESVKWGIKYHIKNPLLGFPNFFNKSQGIFGHFGTDELHVYKLGICKRMFEMVQAIILKLNTELKPSQFQHIIETRVSQTPQFKHILSFVFGYFSGNLNNNSASETEDFLFLVSFALANDSTIITNYSNRRKITSTIVKLIRFMQTIRTPQFLSENDLTELKSEQLEIVKGMEWIHDNLKEDLPGNGFNIPKFHAFLGLLKLIEDSGSISIGSTDRFERFMGIFKKRDIRTKRSMNDDHGKELLEKAVVCQFNESKLPIKKKQKKNYTTKVRSDGFILYSPQYYKIIQLLKESKRGPPLSCEMLNDIEQFLNSNIRNKYLFEQCQVVINNNNENEIFEEEEENGEDSVNDLNGLNKETIFIVCSGNCIVDNENNIYQIIFSFVNDQQKTIIIASKIVDTGVDAETTLRVSKRASPFEIKLIEASTIIKKIHIIPRYSPGSTIPSTTKFFIDDLIGPRKRHESMRYFQDCLSQSCNGKMEYPGETGKFTCCDICNECYRWF